MRRLPPLIALRFFEETARHCSFNRAAAALCVTQSAVSRQIRALEAALDTRLFVRDHQGVRLTADGSELHACITDAFDAIERGIQRLEPIPAREKLILAVPPTFATQWLSPRIESLAAELTDVELSIRTSSDGSEHCHVRFGREALQGQSSKLLWMEQHILVGAPQRAGQPVEALLAELPTMHVLHNDERLDLWPSWLAHAGIAVEDQANAVEFSTLGQAIRAVRKDAGLAIVDYNMVVEELDEGQLAAISPIEVNGSYGYWLDIPPRHAASPAVQAFSSWLQHEARRSA
jgi:LysR family transcriptional regulator, glycine cleavage system transcriptional activator